MMVLASIRPGRVHGPPWACRACASAPKAWAAGSTWRARHGAGRASARSYRSTMPANVDSRPIRVLIVDDHGVVREGLRAYLELEPDIEVVGEARDGLEGVRRAQELHPDVVLMDLVMPNMDGVEATTAIKTERPETHVIVLTSFLDDDRVVPAIK